jgi:hypothetical protein
MPTTNDEIIAYLNSNSNISAKFAKDFAKISEITLETGQRNKTGAVKALLAMLEGGKMLSDEAIAFYNDSKPKKEKSSPKPSKRAPTGYLLFCANQRKESKEQDQQCPTLKDLGSSWKQLDEAGKTEWRQVATNLNAKPITEDEEPKPITEDEEPKPVAEDEEPKPVAEDEEPKPNAEPVAEDEEPKPNAEPVAEDEEPKPNAEPDTESDTEAEKPKPKAEPKVKVDAPLEQKPKPEKSEKSKKSKKKKANSDDE